ncbi:ATP-binding cassette domain-containing protein [Nonomuraea typhae]|uniref:ATP-binding cassette domain-containing protein n=1 Tax=Nonomuraea typhae TaxID=2603600 RepID=A0ABW7YWW0_9ACTN
MVHRPTEAPAVEAAHLERVFRTRYGTTTAVADLDLTVRSGEIVALLGPNGAGKTTTLRMLTTLLRPTGGKATVAGCDLLGEASAVRAKIGYVAQGGSTDRGLRVREELGQQCRFHGLDRAAAGARASELCELLELADVADRPIGALSGGQQRRVEVALGLAHQPQLIFLDEPTLGLDPPGRRDLREHVRRIRDERGTTVVFSTNLTEEADVLCDRVIVIDQGKKVAEGSPLELKRRIAGDVVTFHADDVDRAREAVLGRGRVREVAAAGEALRVTVDDGENAVGDLAKVLADAGIQFRAVDLHRPTLDDVFFEVTGRSMREG